jgi:hypothetical protein
MQKLSARPGELEHPTIAPGQLANLSLYSKDYKGFKLVGWPSGMTYPAEAKYIGPLSEEGALQD